MNEVRPVFLAVGAPEVVLRALRQVLALFEFRLDSVEFTPNVDPTRFNCFGDRDFFLPVLAGSPEAWRVLRAVNLWRRTVPFVRRGLLARPEQMAIEAYASPAVIQLCSGRPASLYEHVVSGGVSLMSALPWMLTLPPSEPDFERAQLTHAALRLFKPDYHAIRPAGDEGEPDNHRQSDFHSALRTLQGAALDGWISSDGWLTASNALLQLAANPIQWAPGNFTAGLRQIAVVQPAPVGTFGTVLVVDDEQFWRMALAAIWDERGVAVRHVKTRRELARMDAGDGPPVRAILLDMKFGEGRYVGVEFLRELKRMFENVPVVVLSVDDDLSVASLLKREGVFASISKQTLAEAFGVRDEISAFCQLRDAIVLACFASLAREFRNLYRVITDSVGVTDTKVEKFEETLGGYVDQALHAFTQGCSNIYADVWEGVGRSRGLSCRQIIRAFGLVNDKWSDLWKACQFDPDHPETITMWTSPSDQSIPHRTYHQITTMLRGEASHARVHDDCFHWVDVWIMAFTLFVKIEGLFRSLVLSSRTDEVSHRLNVPLDICTKSAWSLLDLSGYVAPPFAADTKESFQEHIFKESQLLRENILRWSSRKLSGETFESARELIAVNIYRQRHLGNGRLLQEIDTIPAYCSNRSNAQLRADLLILTLVNTRLTEFLGT